MASLTPAAKGLIAVAIVAVAGAAAWHLGVKNMFKSDGPTATPGADGGTPATPPVAAVPVNGALPKGDGPLGGEKNPLKVSLVSFHGYAPAIVANGKSLKTQPGSIYAGTGANIEFIIQDDIPPLATIFGSNTAHCAWRTSDFWAQEQPNLRNAGFDGRAVMIVDNTQGGDAIIAKDPAIQKVEDLAGKKVALLQFTPSHGLIIDALENSSLSQRKRETVKMVFINADEGTAGVRAAFTSGNVDAAVLWDPDLALAIKQGAAHVVYSTKTATNLIFDVMVCDSRVLADAEGKAAIQKFVDGWMKGVDKAKAEPDLAVDALVETEQFFALLAKDEGKPFVKSLFDNILWTGVADNARVLGLVGGTNHYARVYKRFDEIYRAAGALANPKSPVIDPVDSIDASFIAALLELSAPAKVEAAKPQFTFDDKGRTAATKKEALLTKPVTVSFPPGSHELSKRAQKTIDTDMVPLIENNGAAYFEISGNTDSTGSAAANKALSKQRANAVVDYLIKQWEFPKQRFGVVGNGSSKPLCDEAKPEDGLTLDQCRESNRSTRLAILSR
ncbi:MAG: phosphate ABC transporter substrate-binding/OmpA family protein [Deltaproteobacteria bacterium]|nr:phosphate ABC transporter substrate-binding/OmpA family protein [Deltaproteobacteria bacterium]